MDLTPSSDVSLLVRPDEVAGEALGYVIEV